MKSRTLPECGNQDLTYIWKLGTPPEYGIKKLSTPSDRENHWVRCCSMRIKHSTWVWKSSTPCKEWILKRYYSLESWSLDGETKCLFTGWSCPLFWLSKRSERANHIFTLRSEPITNSRSCRRPYNCVHDAQTPVFLPPRPQNTIFMLRAYFWSATALITRFIHQSKILSFQVFFGWWINSRKYALIMSMR